MKAIICAGGSGTRLQPYTKYYGNKHLVHVADEVPMIALPLKTVQEFNIEEVLLITSPENCGYFTNLLKDGSNLNLKITYKVQKENDGILGAIKLAKDFIGNEERFLVVLGDNYLQLNWKRNDLRQIRDYSNFRIFSKFVTQNASDFGVLTEFGIKEKPQKMQKGHIITGLYIYPSEIFNIIDKFKKSERGEFEVTDLNNYIISEMCSTIKRENYVYYMDKEEFFYDCGTVEKLYEVRQLLKENGLFQDKFNNVFLKG